MASFKLSDLRGSASNKIMKQNIIKTANLVIHKAAQIHEFLFADNKNLHSTLCTFSEIFEEHRDLFNEKNVTKREEIFKTLMNDQYPIADYNAFMTKIQDSINNLENINDYLKNGFKTGYSIYKAELQAYCVHHDTDNFFDDGISSGTMPVYCSDEFLYYINDLLA